MKKDKEWAQKEVDRYLSYEGVNEARNALVFAKGVIDQLDEPEVKQLERKIKELDSFNDELIRDNNQLRNELDEPEVLSQEWIDDNKKYSGVHNIGYYVPIDRLHDLLLPKQEELEVKIQELIETYKQEEDAYSNPENGWISGFIEDLKNLVEKEELVKKKE